LTNQTGLGVNNNLLEKGKRMPIHRRSLTGLLLATGFTMGGARGASAQDDAALAYYRQAKINWRQAEGQSLTIGLNKHPFTESLLPLIPQFRALTGVNVEYLILPEAEYFTKLVADLSQQLRRSQEVEGRRQGRLCADPGWPSWQDVFRPMDVGAGDQQCDQEQDSSLAVRAVGDRAADSAQRHHRLPQL
jgi:hypothetical protein